MGAGLHHWAFAAHAWLGYGVSLRFAALFHTSRSVHLPVSPIPSARPPSPRRDSPDPSPRELKQAVKLLFAAAGIQHLSIERPHKGSGSTGGSSSSSSKAPEFLTASAVNLVLRNDTQPHLGALKELV